MNAPLFPLSPDVIHWVRSVPYPNYPHTPYPYHIGPDLRTQKRWLDRLPLLPNQPTD